METEPNNTGTTQKETSVEEPKIGYVNIFVSNFERSLEFYKTALGLEANVSDESFGYASFQTRGAAFAFACTDQTDLVGRHTGIGWVVPDLDQAYQEMLASGVEFETPPEKQPWGGYLAIFKDPDDNLFYLDELQDH